MSRNFKPLYLCRYLQDTGEFSTWASRHGIPMDRQTKRPHVTIAYSKESVDWDVIMPKLSNLKIIVSPRTVKPLGDMGAIVLSFESDILQQRHRELRRIGCSWDYPSYQPHVTFCWDLPSGINYYNIKPFEGVLNFGEEVMEDISETFRG